jgi:hypothetical protein
MRLGFANTSCGQVLRKTVRKNKSKEEGKGDFTPLFVAVTVLGSLKRLDCDSDKDNEYNNTDDVEAACANARTTRCVCLLTSFSFFHSPFEEQGRFLSLPNSFSTFLCSRFGCEHPRHAFVTLTRAPGVRS